MALVTEAMLAGFAPPETAAIIACPAGMENAGDPALAGALDWPLRRHPLKVFFL